jgi:hypothetical protein
MLSDADRIFTNLYGIGDAGLKGARARGDGDWDEGDHRARSGGDRRGDEGLRVARAWGRGSRPG